MKKPTSLIGSRRRKPRQKIIQAFSLNADEGDVLFPDGLQSVKYNTHLGERGVRIVYLANSYQTLTDWYIFKAVYVAEGGPLWLTLDQASEELIPIGASLQQNLS
jgi:translation initiation factor 2D